MNNDLKKKRKKIFTKQKKHEVEFETKVPENITFSLQTHNNFTLIISTATEILKLRIEKVQYNLWSDFPK